MVPNEIFRPRVSFSTMKIRYHYSFEINKVYINNNIVLDKYGYIGFFFFEI